LFADEIPQAIQWHEGMLLAPQHFQQAAWRQEMLVQYSSLMVSPYSWGVRRLLLDQKLLPVGVVRVLELEAVLPDGSVVSHRPSEGNELIVDLAADISIPKIGSILIHLALPARNAGAMKGGLVRYEAIEGAPAVDENTGEGELRMPVLRPRLSLIAGDAPPPKFVSMPLLGVRFDDETCILSDYIPPCLAVPADSLVAGLCADLARRVRQKAMYLSQQVRAPSTVLDMPMMMEHRAALQSLVSGLPAFEALLATGTAHPLVLYLAACSMAGHLSGLGASLLPPLFSAYNHKDLRATFQEVITFAIRMVNEGIPETYSAFPFKRRETLFQLMFEAQWAARRMVLGMRIATGVTEKEMIAWGEECLIGSESIFPSMRDRRIRGAQRQFIEKDPELAPVRGVVLFNLRPDAEFVRPGELLQIIHLGERGRALSPLEVVLYVKTGG
jgi:type VI secretion system protein ImpJ